MFSHQCACAEYLLAITCIYVGCVRVWVRGYVIVNLRKRERERERGRPETLLQHWDSESLVSLNHHYCEWLSTFLPAVETRVRSRGEGKDCMQHSIDLLTHTETCQNAFNTVWMITWLGIRAQIQTKTDFCKHESLFYSRPRKNGEEKGGEKNFLHFSVRVRLVTVREREIHILNSVPVSLTYWHGLFL